MPSTAPQITDASEEETAAAIACDVEVSVEGLCFLRCYLQDPEHISVHDLQSRVESRLQKGFGEDAPAVAQASVGALPLFQELPSPPRVFLPLVIPGRGQLRICPVPREKPGES